MYIPLNQESPVSTSSVEVGVSSPCTCRTSSWRVSLPGALMYTLSQHAHLAFDLPPGLKAKGALNNEPAAYLCLGAHCQLPVTDPDTLRTQLKALRTAAASTG